MNKNCCDMDGMGNQGRFPNQGKTDKQVEDSERIASFGIVGAVILFVILLIDTHLIN